MKLLVGYLLHLRVGGINRLAGSGLERMEGTSVIDAIEICQGTGEGRE